MTTRKIGTARSHPAAVNGNYAEGEIYSIATHIIDSSGLDSEVVIGGRYLDKYEKRHDSWKITERQDRDGLGPRE